MCRQPVRDGNRELAAHRRSAGRFPGDVVGAQIKLTTASGRLLFNHVSVATGFMSSSDHRVHFGLGAERSVTSIEIRWPGGQVQTLANVMADQILRVREPE